MSSKISRPSTMSSGISNSVSRMISLNMVMLLGLLLCVFIIEDATAKLPKVESEEVRLIHDLLIRARNDAHRLARPVKQVSDGVKIHFGLSLVQILDFDEKNQIITLNVWKHYKWMDEFQRWNASDYGGVDKVILPADALWTPDIVLYDNMDKRDIENHKEKLILKSNGEVEWVPYVVYRSACKVNMENFPFDSQTCSLKFGSWSYAAKELDLVFDNNLTDFRLDQKMENVEWNITDTYAERNVLDYNCCPPERYVDLTYYVQLTRHWGFFFKFMLLPTLLLSCLSLCIFWIPPMRPDRTGLGTSLLGSFMLLLILVTQISPPSEVIKFVTYICCNMGMVCVAVLYSVAVVNISNRNVPVPALTKKLFIEVLGCCCLCHPRPKSRDKDAGAPEGTSAGNNHLLDNPVVIRPVNHQQDWQSVAKVLDRIAFIVFSVYMIICVIFFFPRP